MNHQNAAESTVQAFCRSWFEQRDAEGTLSFLSEDVDYVGTGKNECARGSAAMAAYLRQDIREIPEPFCFALSDIREASISSHQRRGL